MSTFPVNHGGAARTPSLASAPLVHNWFHVARREDIAIVRITGEIGLYGQTAREMLEQIGDAKIISLFIDSRGGDTRAAFELFEGFAGRVDRVTIENACWSSAIILMLSGRTISAHPRAQLMIHRARMYVLGDEEELSAAARSIQKTNERLHSLVNQRVQKRTPVSPAWFDGQDHWFSASDAQAAGLLDSILSTPAGDPAPALAAPVPAAVETLTEDEQVFNEFLNAFGPVVVRDRDAFARSCGFWAWHNSRSANPSIT